MSDVFLVRGVSDLPDLSDLSDLSDLDDMSDLSDKQLLLPDDDAKKPTQGPRLLIVGCSYS